MTKTGLVASLGSTIAAIVFTGCVGEPDDLATDEIQVDQIERADTGHPYFLRGTLGHVTEDIRSPDALAQVLPTIAKTLGLSSSELRLNRIERDSLGMTHVRLAQHKNGLPVISGETILHLDADGVIRSVDSGSVDRDLTATPTLTADAATQIAVTDTRGDVIAQSSQLVYVVSNRDRELYLAWQIKVRGGSDGMPVIDNVYVDALDGRVVDRHPRIYTAKSRTILDGGGGVFPVVGAPTIATEGTPPADPIAAAAYTNTGITYDCYQALYQRDSFNNAGAQLTSQVHVVFDFGNGQTSPANAVWSPDDQMMAYGDGDGTQMSPLAYSLDVTAHELTHAVTSSTADLVYQNESGALNESMSDIFGAVCQAFHDKKVDATTWLVGDDIWTPGTPGDALRYMATPTADGYSPDNYAERLQIVEDSGGVHGNSGIPNLAFYLLSVGGKHPRNKTTFQVPSIGIDKAGAIFQRALTTKMTPNTTMVQARTAVEQAAQELFPNSCAKTATSLAFAAVGVGGAAPTDAAAPTVAISSPATGTKVTAGFQVVVNTTDDQCINKVELLIDGAVVETITEAPFTFTTSPSLTNGAHQIEVKSYDAFNASTASASITVGGSNAGGGDDGSNDVIGGCSTSGSGGGLLLAFGVLGLVIRRRRS